ncbi:hypothetical protein, partial [Mesorhizobium sp.]
SVLPSWCQAASPLSPRPIRRRSAAGRSASGQRPRR